MIRYLLEPFLESRDSLRIDCEVHPQLARVWIRVAFEDPEKGRVYGRGGRNIQAIRTVLDATAKGAGQSIYLDIYDNGDEPRSSSSRVPRLNRQDRSAYDNRPVSRSSSDRPPGRDPFDTTPRTRRRTSSRFKPGGRTDRYFH